MAGLRAVHDAQHGHRTGPCTSEPAHAHAHAHAPSTAPAAHGSPTQTHSGTAERSTAAGATWYGWGAGACVKRSMGRDLRQQAYDGGGYHPQHAAVAVGAGVMAADVPPAACMSRGHTARAAVSVGRGGDGRYSSGPLSEQQHHPYSAAGSGAAAAAARAATEWRGYSAAPGARLETRPPSGLVSSGDSLDHRAATAPPGGGFVQPCAGADAPPPHPYQQHRQDGASSWSTPHPYSHRPAPAHAHPGQEYRDTYGHGRGMHNDPGVLGFLDGRATGSGRGGEWAGESRPSGMHSTYSGASGFTERAVRGPWPVETETHVHGHDGGGRPMLAHAYAEHADRGGGAPFPTGGMGPGAAWDRSNHGAHASTPGGDQRWAPDHGGYGHGAHHPLLQPCAYAGARAGYLPDEDCAAVSTYSAGSGPVGTRSEGPARSASPSNPLLQPCVHAPAPAAEPPSPSRGARDAPREDDDDAHPHERATVHYRPHDTTGRWSASWRAVQRREKSELRRSASNGSRGRTGSMSESESRGPGGGGFSSDGNRLDHPSARCRALDDAPAYDPAHIRAIVRYGRSRRRGHDSRGRSRGRGRTACSYCASDSSSDYEEAQPIYINTRGSSRTRSARGYADRGQRGGSGSPAPHPYAAGGAAPTVVEESVRRGTAAATTTDEEGHAAARQQKKLTRGARLEGREEAVHRDEHQSAVKAKKKKLTSPTPLQSNGTPRDTTPTPVASGVHRSRSSRSQPRQQPFTPQYPYADKHSVRSFTFRKETVDKPKWTPPPLGTYKTETPFGAGIKGGSMGVRPRERKAAPTPGPGSYNYTHRAVEKKAPSITIPVRRADPKPDQMPSPGRYRTEAMRDLHFDKNTPSRWAVRPAAPLYDELHANETPGPGNYDNAYSSFGPQAVTLSKGSTRKARMQAAADKEQSAGGPQA